MSGINQIRRIACVVEIICLTGHSSFAQQSPVYSQYIVNGFVVNPALAGADATTRIGISAHDYLMGVRNAPMTFTASASGRLLKGKNRVSSGKLLRGQSGRIGLGGLVFNDINGLVRRVGVQFTYAYHIDMDYSCLSLGLSGALSQTGIDASRLEFNNSEPLIAEGFSNLAYVPDAVLGIMYRYKDHYIGITASNLFQRSLHFGEFDYNYILYRHYYLLGGTTVDLGRTAFSFAPSFLAKMTSNKVYQAEISTRFIYKNEDVWLAFSYRTPNIASVMVGVRAGHLHIGYAYEYNFGSIRTLSKGSQEVVLVYRIGDTSRRYRWLERY
jgi:type IX secretion system PorP/SprF family membrane protein